MIGDYLLDIGDERCGIFHCIYKQDYMTLMDQVYNFRVWRTNTRKGNIHHSTEWKKLIEFCGTDQIYIDLPANNTYSSERQYTGFLRYTTIPLSVHKNLESVGAYTLLEQELWVKELAVWFPEIQEQVQLQLDGIAVLAIKRLKRLGKTIW